MKLRHVAVTLIVAAVLCAITSLAGSLVPLTGSFTGGSTTVTNTGGPAKIDAVFVTGTISNFSVQVVNVTGYTNTLASALTNELVYTPSLALPWWNSGVLLITTTSTNTALYTVYYSR